MYISNDIDSFGAYCLQEITQPIEMNENTAYKNLNKLVEIGLLEKTEPKGNRREKYFSVLDQSLTKKSIAKYKHWVGFCLARLIPYERQYLSQLKYNKRLIEACEQYGLSVSEGITDSWLLEIGKEQGFEPLEENICSRRYDRLRINFLQYNDSYVEYLRA